MSPPAKPSDGRAGAQRIRMTARAFIVRDGHVLLLRAEDPGRPWYYLPGGGVDYGETMAAACVREAYEETGIHVRVVRPLFLREFIAQRHARRSIFMPKENHAVAVIFLCEPLTEKYGDCKLCDVGAFPGDVDGSGAALGMHWLPLGTLPDAETMPPHVGRFIAATQTLNLSETEGAIEYWPEDEPA